MFRAPHTCPTEGRHSVRPLVSHKGGDCRHCGHTRWGWGGVRGPKQRHIRGVEQLGIVAGDQPCCAGSPPCRDQCSSPHSAQDSAAAARQDNTSGGWHVVQAGSAGWPYAAAAAEGVHSPRHPPEFSITAWLNFCTQRQHGALACLLSWESILGKAHESGAQRCRLQHGVHPADTPLAAGSSASPHPQIPTTTTPHTPGCRCPP